MEIKRIEPINVIHKRKGNAMRFKRKYEFPKTPQNKKMYEIINKVDVRA